MSKNEPQEIVIEKEPYNWTKPLPISEHGKWLDNEMVAEALGYASTCWDARMVFESEKAMICAHNLIHHISETAHKFYQDKIDLLTVKNKSQEDTIDRLQKIVDCIPEYEENEEFSADEWARFEENRLMGNEP